VERPGDADRDVEWLPPEPEGEERPRFDPRAPDPLPDPPPPPAYLTAPPPTGPPVQPAPPQGPPTHGQPPPSAGPPTHRQPPPPPAWQQTPSAPWPHAYGKAPGNGQAVASLILGIAGLVVFVFPAGFGLVFVFNLPCSIAAWVLGVKGRRRVDRGETHEHRSTARWGLVLGIIGTVLGALAIVGWALAIALSDEVRDELRRAVEEGNNS
jgi:hypothetical protein